MTVEFDFDGLGRLIDRLFDRQSEQSRAWISVWLACVLGVTTAATVCHASLGPYVILFVVSIIVIGSGSSSRATATAESGPCGHLSRTPGEALSLHAPALSINGDQSSAWPRPAGRGQDSLPEEVPSSERLAEARLVEALRQVDFDPNSTHWIVLSGALIEYGYSVLTIWGASHHLYEVAMQRGARGLTARSRKILEALDEEQARTLATDVLSVAINVFRERSLPAWSPTGGASLRTYFIGRCLLELPRVLHEWRQREMGRFDLVALDEVPEDLVHVRSADGVVEAAMEVDELFDGQPVLRRAFELQQAGYSLGEIVEILNEEDTPITTGSLRTRMHRLRATASGTRKGNPR